MIHVKLFFILCKFFIDVLYKCLGTYLNFNQPLQMDCRLIPRVLICFSVKKGASENSLLEGKLKENYYLLIIINGTIFESKNSFTNKKN